MTDKTGSAFKVGDTVELVDDSSMLGRHKGELAIVKTSEPSFLNVQWLEKNPNANRDGAYFSSRFRRVTSAKTVENSAAVELTELNRRAEELKQLIEHADRLGYDLVKRDK